MNKKAVRIGVIGAAVISSILFVLFLPTFLWSPPWSENGYYTPNSDKTIVDALIQSGVCPHNTDSQYHYLKFHKADLLLRIINRSDNTLTDLPLTILPTKSTTPTSFSTDSNLMPELYITLEGQGNLSAFMNHRDDFLYKKTYSPFTLLHIKYCEYFKSNNQDL